MDNTNQTKPLDYTAEAINHRLSLIAENKNLLEYPYDDINFANYPDLENVGDGSILVVSKTVEKRELLLNDLLLKPDKYVISLTITDLFEKITNLSGCTLIVKEDNDARNDEESTLVETSNSEVLNLSTEAEEKAVLVYLTIPAGSEKGLLIKPQIEKGTEKTDWVPNMDKIGTYVDRRFNGTNTKLALINKNISKNAEDIQGIREAIANGVGFIGITNIDLSTDDNNERSSINIIGKEEAVDAKNGDIVIYDTHEFIWDGNKWEELGDVTRIGAIENALSEHKKQTSGAHTKSAVGLGNVENKSTATIKAEFTGAVAAADNGFVTGDAVYSAIESATTAVVGSDNDTSTVQTVQGAKKYAEDYAKNYAAPKDLGQGNAIVITNEDGYVNTLYQENKITATRLSDLLSCIDIIYTE